MEFPDENRNQEEQPLQSAFAEPLRLPGWPELFMVFLITFLLLMFGSGIMQSFKKLGLIDPQFERHATLIISSLCLQGGGLVVMFLVARKSGISLVNAFGLHRENISGSLQKAGIVSLLLIPFVSLLYHAITLLLNWLGIKVNLQLPVQLMMEGFLLPVQILFAVILAPLWEELFFRGFLFSAFQQSFGKWPAILVSSICFALMHDSVATYLPLFVLSVAWCLLNLRCGSLLASIFAHALFNFTSVVGLIISRNAQGGSF